MVEMKMKLAELLQDPQLPEALRDLSLCGLCLDSRRLQAGEAFLACRGEMNDGSRFIAAAVARGASVVLVDPRCAERPSIDVPLLEVPGLVERLGELAGRFYAEPAKRLRLMAITGTNGKTSCSHFLSRALCDLGSATAVVGTNGFGYVDQLQRATHTTPDVLSLQQMLAELVAQRAEAVAMEVSSHALEQGRVAGLEFDYGIFTNLTRDHLDYHGSMAAYGQAKRCLFTDYPLRHAVINRDDPFGDELYREIRDRVATCSYSLSRADADVHVLEHRFTASGIDAQVATPWGQVELHTPLYGAFNLHNLMAVIAVLGLEGYAPERIGSALSRLVPVEGRMQRFGGAGQPLVVIDYAHTPDALEKALAGLREHVQGRLWCLFGCGGDRDRGKRPLMGEVAVNGADRVVLTSDNPRSEDPQAIIEEIRQGTGKRVGVSIEPDRGAAIRQVISQAAAEDLILVAGKGHEDYQEIGGHRYPFEDAREVRAALSAREAGR